MSSSNDDRYSASSSQLIVTGRAPDRSSHAFDRCGTREQILTSPVFVYAHASDLCSIAGGRQHPRHAGMYVTADFCAGRATGLLPDDPGGCQSLLPGDIGNFIATIDEDANGELTFAEALPGFVFGAGTLP